MEKSIIRELEKLLGRDAVLSAHTDLLMYEYDGSVEQARPECVVFPRTREDVVGIVKLANRTQTPIVARGAGTGLSGGALARRGGIMIAFPRMNRILETVTVKDSRGNVHVIGDVDPAKMAGVTLGQTIVIEFTQAIALSIEPGGEVKSQ